MATIELKQVEKKFGDSYAVKPLDMTINRAFDVYTLQKDEKELTEKLGVTNAQLEFLLRQQLLS